jgi:hypothetical protein
VKAVTARLEKLKEVIIKNVSPIEPELKLILDGTVKTKVMQRKSMA